MRQGAGNRRQYPAHGRHTHAKQSRDECRRLPGLDRGADEFIAESAQVFLSHARGNDRIISTQPSAPVGDCIGW